MPMQEAGGVLGSCLRERRARILPARAACASMGYSLQTAVFLHSRAKSYTLHMNAWMYVCTHTCMCMYTHTHTHTHTHQAAASMPGNEDANLMAAVISFFVLLGTIGYWMFLRSKAHKEKEKAEEAENEKAEKMNKLVRTG